MRVHGLCHCIYLLYSLSDPTFTVENLAAVYNKAPLLEEEWGNRWSKWNMLFPEPTFTEIQEKYNSVKEKNRAAAAYLVKIDPNSSWVEVAKYLNDFSQLEALDEARKYLPKKGLWYVCVH